MFIFYRYLKSGENPASSMKNCSTVNVMLNDSDRSVGANCADLDQTAPKEQSDQGLHCFSSDQNTFDRIDLPD